jgi:hypothetical protein
MEELFKKIVRSDELGCEGICNLVVEEDDVDPAVALSWVYPKRSNFERYCDLRGFPQNLVTLALPLRLVNRASVLNSILEDCGQFASRIVANYGRGWCHEHERGRPEMGRGGIASGLPDAYWLNFFGKPFVSIIGAAKLDRMPRTKSVESIRLVTASEKYESGDSMFEARRLLRSEIGEEFFRKKAGTEQAQSSGVLSFLLGAYKTKRRFEADEGAAAKRAVIEWELFDENR